MISLLRQTPLPIIAIVLSLICPSELSLFVGTLRLPPHRLMILIMVIWACAHFLSRAPFRLRSYDVLFFAYACWSLGIFIHHEGTTEGLEFGGALALESFGAYWVARVFIRDLHTFRATISFLFVAVLCVGAFAVPEALLKQHFVHDFLYKMTGYFHPLKYEQRMGLLRAYSTFDHPIHYGTFCASILAVVWYTSRNTANRITRCGLVGTATFFGLSSAPILCALSQIAFTGWEYVTRRIVNRMTMLTVFLIGAYLIVDMLSDRNPLTIAITKFTLDPWTGIYRTYIWQYGMENVWAHPFTGIGLDDWKRPAWMHAPSVDAFWLVIMMRGGIPALAVLTPAILLLVFHIHRAQHGLSAQAVIDARTGWTISLIALSLAACTVHYWNAIHAYFFFFLGMAAWIADSRHAITPEKSVKPSTAGQQARFSQSTPQPIFIR